MRLLPLVGRGGDDEKESIFRKANSDKVWEKKEDFFGGSHPHHQENRRETKPAAKN